MQYMTKPKTKSSNKYITIKFYSERSFANLHANKGMYMHCVQFICLFISCGHLFLIGFTIWLPNWNNLHVIVYLLTCWLLLFCRDANYICLPVLSGLTAPMTFLKVCKLLVGISESKYRRLVFEKILVVIFTVDI